MNLKPRFLLIVLALFSVVPGVWAQSISSLKCAYARVDWEDASLYAKLDVFDNEELLTPQSSVGCILLKNPRTLVVVYNVNKGKPDTFVAIPTGWIVKITFLKENEEISKGDVKEILRKLAEKLAASDK